MNTPIFLDMVHHNPGEPPFETRFTNPKELSALGYTGQVLKHLNACIPLGFGNATEFPGTPEEEAWLAGASAMRDAEIAAAKQAGVEIFYHVDLFVLPKRIIERHRAALCDKQGRIDITRPATLELHRKLFAGLFERYPDVSGLVIRVGETYLFDTPHHGGNTAVPLHDGSIDRDEQIRRFIILLQFLREEVCVRYGRTLIYRTWDFGFHFHESPDFYLGVTDAIEPHPSLIFSIKHTTGDFFRGCVPNPCLGLGRHRQIVEVQCQREYEGKGAYTSYIARGVIEGFPEVPQPQGLRDWCHSPLWAGVWTWSRGGGWFGPYLKNEFWCELNVRVIAAWMQSPDRTEKEAFDEVCEKDFGMGSDSRVLFRELCLAAEEAIWLGRSSPALARITRFSRVDVVGLWMRDDRLGGLDQVHGLFAELLAGNCLMESIQEKKRAALLFMRMQDLAARIQTADPLTGEAIRTSAAYGAHLFAIIAKGWELMVRIWLSEHDPAAQQISRADVSAYRQLWNHYRTLPSKHPTCATLYEETYWAWPGDPPTPGMSASILDAVEPQTP
jgi:hypothetical protein